MPTFADQDTPPPPRFAGLVRAAILALPVVALVCGLIQLSIDTFVRASVVKMGASTREAAARSRCATSPLPEDQRLCACLESPSSTLPECVHEWYIALVSLGAQRCETSTVRQRARSFCACVETLQREASQEGPAITLRYPRCASLPDAFGPPLLE